MNNIIGNLVGGGGGFILLLTIVLVFSDYLNKVSHRINYTRAVPASAKVVKVSRSIGKGTYGGLIVNITLDVIPTDAEPYQVKNIGAWNPWPWRK